MQRIDGAHTGDDAGDRVANAGDVNHDGRDDIIVGAYTADAGGRVNAGAAYLVRSSAARHVKLGTRAPPASSSSAAAHRATTSGRWSPASATSTATGAPDQAVGSYDLTRARPRQGRLDLGDPLDAAASARSTSPRRPPGIVRIDGSAADAEIDPAAAAGDFNGDGIADLVVGETDAAYVILGSTSFGAVDLANPGANVLTISPESQASLGLKVAGVGDVNGDGLVGRRR